MRARRGAVDLIGQQHVGKRRALQELELAALLVEVDTPVTSLGNRSGVHWRRLKLTPRLVARTGKHSLADAGHILQQHVPIAQQGHQQEFDHIALADDHTFDIVANLAGKGLD